jgi:hypothetical protein
MPNGNGSLLILSIFIQIIVVARQQPDRQQFHRERLQVGQCVVQADNQARGR